MEATFDGDIPDISQVPGVSSVQTVGRTVRCQVRGSIEPLLQTLAVAGVHQLLSHEPSLEELFLTHYGQSTEMGDPPADGD